MEENFTSTELWLGMNLVLATDDGCPFTVFDVREGDLPFCDGRVEREDDGFELDEDDDDDDVEHVLRCPRMASKAWIAELGKCWVRYARLQAKSADALEIEKQVWQEDSNKRR